jgi:serine/threonine protein phosphatase PrpC
VVPDEKIASFIKENPDIQKCADGLGQLALEMGSRDNVSCILIHVS